jgi:hypothetical protein
MAGPIIKAVLTGDGTGFQLMMGKAQGAVKGLQSSIGAGLKSRLAGLFALGAIEEGVRRTVLYADKISDMAKRTGDSTSMMQEMDYTISQTTGSLEGFASAIEKVNRAREKALGGDDKMLANFERLGVGPEQLRRMRGGDILTGPVGAALRSGDAAKFDAPLQAIAGRGIGELKVALMEFEEKAREIRSMGGIISPRDIEAMAKIKDQFSTLATIMRAELAPAIVNSAAMLIAFIGAIKAVGAVALGVGKNMAGKSKGTLGKEMLEAWQDNFSRMGFLNLLPNPAMIGAVVGGAARMAGTASAEAKSVETFDRINAETQAKIQAFLDGLGGKKPGGGDLDDLTGLDKTKKTSKRESSDSLVRIGNFLGTSSIQLIGERQVQLQTRMTVALERLVAMGRMNKFAEGFEGTVGPF